MNKKGQIVGNPLLVLILLFMVLIIGFALLNPVTSTNNQLTQKAIITNQTLSLIPAFINSSDVNASINITIYLQSDWKKNNGNDCALSSVGFASVNGTILIQNTDYTLYTSSGTMTLLNSSINSPATSLNKTYANYTFCRDGYITDAGTRNLTSLITTMMIMVLIITGALVAYKQMNQ